MVLRNAYAMYTKETPLLLLMLLFLHHHYSFRFLLEFYILVNRYTCFFLLLLVD